MNVIVCVSLTFSTNFEYEENICDILVQSFLRISCVVVTCALVEALNNYNTMISDVQRSSLKRDEKIESLHKYQKFWYVLLFVDVHDPSDFGMLGVMGS